MDVRNVAMMAASGVIMRADPVKWWVFLLALIAAAVIATAIAIPCFSAMDSWKIPDGVGGLIMGLAAGLLAAAVALPLMHWSGSVSSSNRTAIESQYGVSSLAATGKGSFLPNSKPISVTFRDSQGTHKGKVVIKGNRAVLRVDNTQPDSEYIRGANYSYSNTLIDNHERTSESGDSCPSPSTGAGPGADR